MSKDLQLKKISMLKAYSAVILSSFILYPLGNVLKKDIDNAGKQTAGKTIISCGTSYLSNQEEIAEPFVPVKDPDGPRIRQNIYKFKSINNIRLGLSRMKDLDGLSKKNKLYKTSLQFQTDLHSLFIEKQKKSLKNKSKKEPCIHNLGFFLSWHRMYLYFFEQILISKSGNKDLALPYWDYDKNKALPAAYKIEKLKGKINNSYINPLYDATRNSDINKSGSLPKAISATVEKAMDETDFKKFEAIILDLHSAIHLATGVKGKKQSKNGNMADLKLSPKDPVFWLHHTNIDRLWEKWLAMGGGRTNPTVDNEWMNQSYIFYDIKGNPIKMYGYQIVNTAETLNYYYDDLGLPVTSNRIPIPATPEIITTSLMHQSTPVLVNKRITRLSLKSITIPANSNLNNYVTVPDNVRICFQASGLQVNELPAGIVEIYLVKAGAIKTTTFSSKTFAGLLNLFASDNRFDKDKPLPAVDLDITDVMRNQNISPGELKNMVIVFLVKGNSNAGREITTSAEVKLKSVSIVANESNQPLSNPYQPVFQSK